jgi:hypothetical protein
LWQADPLAGVHEYLNTRYTILQNGSESDDDTDDDDPDLVSDSEDEKESSSDEDEMESDSNSDEDFVPKNHQMFDEARPGVGTRLVDIAKVLSFVEKEMVCRRCAAECPEQTIKAFREFVADKAGRNDNEHEKWLNRMADEFVNSGNMPTVATMKMRSEVLHGFASDLSFQCGDDLDDSPHSAVLETSKKVDKVDDPLTGNARPGPRLYEANMRATYGAFHTGRGASDLFQQAAFQNIPLNMRTSEKMFSAAEEVFGPQLEALAEKSCEEVRELLRAECVASGAKQIEIDGKKYWSVVIAVDGSWSKRGTGHIYDSNDGSCTSACFLKGGVRKIPWIKQYMKSCKKCNRWRKANKPTKIVPDDVRKAHKCRENHRDEEGNTRSSGSMETRGCVEICLAAIDGGFVVKKFVMDDDASTPSWVCEGGKHFEESEIPKGLGVEFILADFSHHVRTVGGRFFQIAGRSVADESAGDSRFSRDCAGEMKKYFSYVLSTHRKADVLDPALYKRHHMQALEHAFGRCKADDPDPLKKSKTGDSCSEFFDCPNCKELGPGA